MKFDTGKLSRHQGSSSGGEAGPLFPPLHVKDTGKASVRAPPRNKMALFEQFTVPYSRCLPSSKAVAAETASQQHATNDLSKTYTHYTLPPAAEIGKPSHGSSLGSLSTSSAVVNVDEPQRFQVRNRGDNLCSSTEPKLGMVSGKGRNSIEKITKDCSKKFKVAKGVCLSSHFDDKSEACEQAAGLAMKGFHKWDKGFITDRNPISEDSNPKGRSWQEATFNFKEPNLMGRPYQKATSNNVENADAPTSNESNVPNQLKSTGRCSLESAVNGFEKQLGGSQVDMPSMAATAPTSTCDVMKSSPVPPFSAIIKPKDVIHAVGQQLFWKARRAILSQQEVFSNQVFELHKLIEVQKLLAKMPTTLFDEHLLSGMASDKDGVDLYPVEVNFKKQEKSNKGAQQVPAPPRREGQVYEWRPLQRSLPCEEREGEGVGAASQTQGRSHNSYCPQALTNAPFNQSHHSSSFDGLSAWGYPMGSLNRQFLYPPGAGGFPSGSSYGGPYVVGSNPLLAPFTFTCYPQRPDQQQQPNFCHTNQWSTQMYQNPFLAPMANNWFGMNHPGQVPLASGSEKPGPTSSAPSINMKVEVSSQSVQPAAVPLSRRQKMGCSKQIATKLFGSVATASVPTAPDALSGKSAGPITDPGGGSRSVPQVWRGIGVETRAAIEAMGPSKDSKGSELPLWSSRLVSDPSLRNNDLFPIQPSSRSGGAIDKQVVRRDEGNHGRVIKAIPRSALAASESAAGILLSIQRERQLSL